MKELPPKYTTLTAIGLLLLGAAIIVITIAIGACTPMPMPWPGASPAGTNRSAKLFRLPPPPPRDTNYHSTTHVYRVALDWPTNLHVTLTTRYGVQVRSNGVGQWTTVVSNQPGGQDLWATNNYGKSALLRAFASP